jgi:O-antigen ligase/tetratricopeptide (TPR) repeat protein
MRLRRLSIVFLAFYFTFLGGGAYYTLFFPVRVAHHVLVTLLAVLWLITRLRKGRGLPKTPLDWPLALALGAWVLASLAGIDPRMSLEHLWFLLVHTLAFCYLVERVKRGDQKLLMEAVFFMAAIVVFFSGLEVASWLFGLGFIPGTQVGWLEVGRLPTLQELPTLSLALGISTLLAGYVAPLITVCIGWASSTTRRDYRVVLWGLALLLLIVLILTSARGGAVSLLAALAVFSVFRLAQTPRISARIRPRWLLAGGALVGMAAVVGFVLYSIPQGNNTSNLGRLDMLQGAAELTLQHPLTGVGVGQFGRAFREVRDPGIAQDKLASAHNVYANSAAETGILGVAAGLLLMGAFVWRTWQHWLSAGRGTRIRIEAVFAALVGVAVHSMVDVFSITPLVLLIVTLAAYAVTPQPRSRLDPVQAGRRGLAWLALLIFVGYGAWLLLLDAAQNRYMQSLDASDIPQALADVRAAQALDPHLRLYDLHAAYLLGLDNTRPLAQRIAAYEDAVTLEPTWDVGWMNLAALYEQADDIPAALHALDTAYGITQLNSAGIHWARLAEAHAAGTENAIIKRYLRGIQVRSFWHLPLSPFWSGSPLRRAATERYLSSPSSNSATDYRVYAVHDPQSAAASVPTDPQSAAEYWVVGQHALERGERAAAADAFTQAIELEPTEGDYYASRARALLVISPAQALADLDRAQAIGTQREYPLAIRARLIQSVTQRLQMQAAAYSPAPEPQEFAAVLYNRPAVFRVTDAMAHPGPGREALRPWLAIAAYYEERGNDAQAQRWYSLVRSVAPFMDIP